MANSVSVDAWHELLARLGLSDLNAVTHGKLVAAYGRPDRHYHTLAHVDDCLEQLAACALPDAQADPIALALWFHDAVYNWRSKTNEIDSATWAEAFLSGCDADQALSDRVHGLIMATCHVVPEPLAGDQLLMSDIDLSILGRAPQVYDRYERAIAEEYKWVPKVTFRRERRKILRGFLEREAIYHTARFNDLYEDQARINLKRAIDNL